MSACGEAENQDCGGRAKKPVHEVHHRFVDGFLDVGVEKKIGGEFRDVPQECCRATGEEGCRQFSKGRYLAEPTIKKRQAFPREISEREPAGVVVDSVDLRAPTLYRDEFVKNEHRDGCPDSGGA